MPLTHDFDAAALLPYADEIVSTVERDGVAGLDPARSCHAISTIKTAIEYQALESGLCRFNDRHITAFMPGILTREFNALAALCHNLQFSDAWHNRVRAASETLAQQIFMIAPPAKLEKIRHDKRLPFLSAIAAQQSRLFSDSTMQFKNPGIELMKDTAVKGQLNFDDPASVKLVIGEYFLANDPMAESLKTIWHENLHSFHLQLLAMKTNGTISSGHELYDDAIMLEAKLEHGAFIQFYYPPHVYSADVEERLCLQSEDEFMGAYHRLDAIRNYRPE